VLLEVGSRRKRYYSIKAIIVTSLMLWSEDERRIKMLASRIINNKRWD